MTGTRSKSGRPTFCLPLRGLLILSCLPLSYLHLRASLLSASELGRLGLLYVDMLRRGGCSSTEYLHHAISDNSLVSEPHGWILKPCSCRRTINNLIWIQSRIISLGLMYLGISQLYIPGDNRWPSPEMWVPPAAPSSFQSNVLSSRTCT